MCLIPQEVVLQWCLGLMLHGLSAYGVNAAQSLAESVGTKWLQEVTSLTDTQQVRRREGGRERERERV